MKNTNFFRKTMLGAFSIAFLIAATPDKNTYTVSNDYAVTIHGTSNLHAWDEKVQKVTGKGSINWNNDGSFDLNAISIKMDVHSIKSDMGSVMDNNTYKALKADEHPEIIFTLIGTVKSVLANSNNKIILVSGNLTIAGVTRFVQMKAKVNMQGKGKLIFEGSQPIAMTDYGISPPTALFGTMKTGNDITINFKISFQ
jgi:polyisoprenoid-binding protein YceI